VKEKRGIALVDVGSVIASIAAEQPEVPEEQKDFVSLEEAREDEENSTFGDSKHWMGCEMKRPNWRRCVKHRIHDFTIATTEDKAGVTVFPTTPLKADEAMRRLRSYCPIKKHHIRADSWVGFLTIVDEQPIIQGFMVIHDPWTYDERMEPLVADLPSSQNLRT
jgi:hypothetical protein